MLVNGMDDDWAPKAIVYFCTNYTIDKHDLMPHMQDALKNNAQGIITCSGSWYEKHPGYDFWDCLYYLASGARTTNQECKCKPWTDAEKRMIAKMPKVKR